MTEGQGSYEFFFCVLVLFGIDADGVGGADTLVTAAAIRHHGNHGTAHSGVAGRSRTGNDMRIDAVAEDTFGQRTVDGLAQVVPVVALQCFARGVHVVGAGFQDEADLLQWRSCGEIIHQSKV